MAAETGASGRALTRKGKEMSELILVFDDASYMALQASKMLEEVELDTESLGQLEVLFIVPGGAAEQLTLDDAMQRNARFYEIQDSMRVFFDRELDTP